MGNYGVDSHALCLIVGAGALDSPFCFVVLRGVEGAAPYRSPSGKCEPRAFGAAMRILYPPGQKEKKKDTDWWSRNRDIHALREDFCRLPLTSELDALCAANANPAPLALW